MADYISKYQGEQIDEAVEKAIGTNGLSKDIKDEADRAKASEQQLASMLDRERSRAQKAESDILTKADSANLKIGDIDNLITTNKNSLVEAINEVKSSSGSGSADMGLKMSVVKMIGDSKGVYDIRIHSAVPLVGERFHLMRKVRRNHSGRYIEGDNRIINTYNLFSAIDDREVKKPVSTQVRLEKLESSIDDYIYTLSWNNKSLMSSLVDRLVKSEDGHKLIRTRRGNKDSGKVDLAIAKEVVDENGKITYAIVLKFALYQQRHDNTDTGGIEYQRTIII